MQVSSFVANNFTPSSLTYKVAINSFEYVNSISNPKTTAPTYLSSLYSSKSSQYKGSSGGYK